MTILKKLNIVLCLLLTACVQMPTGKSAALDTRPKLIFPLNQNGWAQARVLVDGLDLGVLGDYQESLTALRVLPGTHRVKIILDGHVRFDEKIYVGDGAYRVLRVQ